MSITHNLKEPDIIHIDVESQLEHQETKECGWIFDKINSMRIRFYKTVELNGSSYVKFPLRSNAFLNIENNDKYCFLWSTLAFLNPRDNSHPTRVLNYIQYFDELSIEGFDFTNCFNCIDDVQNFEKLSILSINLFELNFYQDKNILKQSLIPTEISKNDQSDRLVDLLIYKNHYALIKKIH